MGRRQKRKRERRQQQRAPDALAWSTGSPVASPPSQLYVPEEEEYEYLFQSFGRGALPGIKVCGGCKEFIEDAEGGRGTCLHPGSGILSPWTDTPGCDFHMRRR